MQLQQFVNTFGQDLSHRYGEKVHKLTLHGGFTCPNRDGTIGRGGCTFCNVSSFVDEKTQYKSIQEQLAARAKEVQRAKKYLAYFQAYTSTYAEYELLHAMYQEALTCANIVGLCVGTRPDCVTTEVLDLLASYKDSGFEIWLELGLQTAHDKTLKKINRGHDYQAYAKVASAARLRGLKVGTHLIVGLPGEGMVHNLETIEKIVTTGTDGIKLHPLHIVTGSTMAKAWQAGRMTALELDTYVDIASEMIRATPAKIVYHRVTAVARRPTLLAPLWCESRWGAMNAIGKKLQENGVQGSAIGDPFNYLR